jgi:two-component system cell cycle sensor histidine kinase/response regulator CckA
VSDPPATSAAANAPAAASTSPDPTPPPGATPDLPAGPPAPSSPWPVVATWTSIALGTLALFATGWLTLPLAVVVTLAAAGASGLWLARRNRLLVDALAAAALAREARAEERRLEAIGRLAGGIAHDVNNYLAAIRAQSELLLRKEAPREVVVRRLEGVVETVIKAAALLDRLLAVGRRQVARREPLRLAEVIDNLLVMLHGSWRPDLELAVEVPADLPPVWFDLGQLEQCLTNLLVNAADATPAPGGRITLRARLLASGTAAGDPPAGVELAVEDNGCGIDPAVLPRIFDPFFTTKAGHGSSGLGLATVRALVEEAGGRVSVESTPGRGARFCLQLPLAPTPGAAAGERSARHPASTSAGAAGERGSRDRRHAAAGTATAPPSLPAGTAGRGARVLLVDDYADLRHAAAAQLRQAGYVVVACASVAEALAAAAEPPAFAVVVTDVRLADGTGPDLVAQLRQRAPVAALYMSGYTDRIALRGAGRGGARDEAFFLKKPFSAEGLVRMVGELLAKPDDAEATADDAPLHHDADPQGSAAPDAPPR